ncbi:ABC transporter ATP-binding protein [Paludibacterium paludis]|uniref:ABC transporter n=1 Tax=Paludibacterium paludis TaxID=1225769 RepID=A0A918NY30_9NEIS|nr:ABC transporter ATP-binding protein [Paludibacterium paludis]GGY03570.1 ABC transporter [Paludibacterium paludis]
MLKTFLQLLGEDAPIFRRYVAMAVAYGVLCGLSVTALAPALVHLLAGDTGNAAPWLAALLAGVAVSWGWRRRVEHAGVRVGVAILQGARHRLGNHVAQLPVGWFLPQNTARLGHVVTQGMMAIAQLPAHVFTPVIASAVTAAVLVVALFVLHGAAGWVALIALPLMTAILALTARLSRRADEAFQRRFAESSQRVVEFARAQSVLRAFNSEGGSTRWLEQTFERQHRSGSRLIWLSAGASVLNVWFVQTVFAALLFAVAFGMSGSLSVDDVMASIVSLLLAGLFVNALLEVVGYGEVLRGARGQLEAIRELFAVKPLPQPEAPRAPRDASVELRDVHFRYAAGEPEVLSGVSLRIEPGSMVALIGESGSGKTTLMRLIPRFFDVNRGSVLVGGVDVRDMADEPLAGLISQIFQDSYLFAGSIADNLRVGNPAADDERIMNAARQAGVTGIAERLPEGLATRVGEGGARLSGGERQRIAIARALIKDAPILLVDEATAALDTENQAIIAETLARLRHQRTLLVIAHQLSTVAMADHIVVLEGGRIVEQGSPAHLRDSGGRYAQFLRQRRAAKGWRIAPAASTGERG